MKRQIILYDGDCNLCNGTVRFVKKRDPKNRFEFLSFQSNEAQVLMQRFGKESSTKNSVIFFQDNSHFTKSTAVLHVLKTLGPPWSFFYFLRFIPLPLRDFVYDLVAKYRYKVFGKRQQNNESC